MRLEKWLADVVHQERVFVHYRARLSLGPFNVGYRGTLDDDRPLHGAFAPGR